MQPLELQRKSKSKSATPIKRVHWAQRRVEKHTVEALQKRSFHLPTNTTWCEDWRQYLANNHPLWGICCADKLHPIGWGQRILPLGISILVGFTFTNIAVWWSTQQEAFLDNDVVSIKVSTNDARFREGDSMGLSMTMLFLWTWISCVHAFHDCVVWYFCCCSTIAAQILWLVVWMGASIAFGGLVMSEQGEDELDPILMLIYAAVEVVCSWLIWFPLVATVLFSGILGCFRLPILGGRPRDLFLEANHLRGLEKIPVNTMDSLADYDASTMA